MKKFEELSRESQCAAVEVLKEVIIQSHKSRNEVDGQRLEFNAHSIREAFIALESERPLCSSDELISHTSNTKPNEKLE